MGKVIDFNSIKQLPKSIIGYIQYEIVDRYKGLLEAQAGIMDCLLLDAEEILTTFGYSPSKFTLVEDSAKVFLAVDMMDFVNGDASLDLSFYANIDGETYRTLSTATCDEGDAVEIDSMLLKWNGEEWLAFNGQGWEQGPGNDFFG